MLVKVYVCRLETCGCKGEEEVWVLCGGEVLENMVRENEVLGMMEVPPQSWHGRRRNDTWVAIKDDPPKKKTTLQY